MKYCGAQNGSDVQYVAFKLGKWRIANTKGGVVGTANEA